VLVRTNGDPRLFLEAIGRELERLPTPLEGFFGRTLLDHLRSYQVPGLLLGVAGALALGRLAASFLYGVHTADPPTLFASVALLTLVVLFASWLPARRAVRMDPVSS
jgi:hypothetical protein